MTEDEAIEIAVRLRSARYGLLEALEVARTVDAMWLRTRLMDACQLVTVSLERCAVSLGGFGILTKWLDAVPRLSKAARAQQLRSYKRKGARKRQLAEIAQLSKNAGK